MNLKYTKLQRRVLELSYKHSLGHIGSCLSCVDAIEDIYKRKQWSEPFILSNGHAGLALYVVMEKFHNFTNAEYLLEKHGVHPNRDLQDGINVSTGSLGHGLPIALGMALADRSRNVYCMISDGECSEGSIWEVLRIMKEQKVENLFVYVNCNGYGAYKEIDSSELKRRLNEYQNVTVLRTESDFADTKGLEAHYKPLTKEQYESLYVFKDAKEEITYEATHGFLKGKIIL